MPYLDPYLTTEQSSKIAPYARQLYQEMETDLHFRQLGSVQGWAYAELIGQPFDVGHYYLYVPKVQHKKPIPAIVFLHGSAGNFKVYLWLWSKLAEQHQMAIIAPSFGFGNWRKTGGSKAVSQALKDAATIVNIDEDQIYLAGLSNGGLGVSQLAEETPEKYRGLIFISPVMATEIVDEKPFLNAWQNRPVLILTGALDKRIPIDYVKKRSSNFKAAGLAVTEVIYHEEDHFLFFTQAEDVLDKISIWLTEVKESDEP